MSIISLSIVSVFVAQQSPSLSQDVYFSLFRKNFWTWHKRARMTVDEINLGLVKLGRIRIEMIFFDRKCKT